MADSLVEPKVFYDWGTKFLVGPLGFWRTGDSIVVKGSACRVGALDLDGAATAWPVAQLVNLGTQWGCDADEAFERVKDKRWSGEGGLTLEQKAQCERIAAVGVQARLDDGA